MGSGAPTRGNIDSGFIDIDGVVVVVGWPI